MQTKVYDRKVKPAEMLRHRRAWKLGPNLYRVFGRAGNPYVIPVVGGMPLCPCEAGTGGHGRFRPRPCFHAIRVAMRLEREGVA